MLTANSQWLRAICSHCRANTLWVGENLLCMFLYRFSISVLLLQIQLSRWEGWDPTNQLTLHMYVSVPRQDWNFQHHISWYFFFSMIWGERQWFVLFLLAYFYLQSLLQLSFHNLGEFKELLLQCNIHIYFNWPHNSFDLG